MMLATRAPARLRRVGAGGGVRNPGLGGPRGGGAGQGAGRRGSPAPNPPARGAAPNMGRTEAAGRRHGAGRGPLTGGADGAYVSPWKPNSK